MAERLTTYCRIRHVPTGRWTDILCTGRTKGDDVPVLHRTIVESHLDAAALTYELPREEFEAVEALSDPIGTDPVTMPQALGAGIIKRRAAEQMQAEPDAEFKAVVAELKAVMPAAAHAALDKLPDVLERRMARR